MFSENARIGGTLIWYWSICHRQVWLMARGIEPDPSNEHMVLGRLIDENSYTRERHQVAFGDNKFDFIQSEGNRVIVCEVKKSSRAEASARLQLAHYLYELEKMGIEANGVLMFPKEKKRVSIELTMETKNELDGIYKEIKTLTELGNPPPAKSGKYCPKCSYAEYCWG